MHTGRIQRTALTFIVMIYMLSAILFGSVLLVSHSEHTCIEDQCSVCLHIEHFKSRLRQLSTAVSHSFYVSVYTIALTVSVLAVCILLRSLFSLKVKLNN